MSPNNDPVMPIDHRDCFAGANKFCHGELSEYGFIVDSHFLINKFRLNIKMRCLPRFFKNP